MTEIRLKMTTKASGLICIVTWNIEEAAVNLYARMRCCPVPPDELLAM
jgi:hypothetical protein